jgi:DNA topoisomerase-3
MVRILSVAEKPSVAKELSRIIGANCQVSHRRGHSQYNLLYEIPQCQFRGNQCSMVMTSVTGHLMELEFDKAFKGWNSCQPSDLFDATILKTVKKENEGRMRYSAKVCRVVC